MHNFKPLSIFIFLVGLGASCGKPLPNLNGVDLNSWKEDKNGCNGTRAQMIEAMAIEKDKLKKLSEMDLLELLGRPDENQLLTRNQKFYIYYLEPGPNCDTPKSDARKLILRINAMSLTKETQIK